MIGVPTNMFKEYFDKNNLPYDPDFKPDYQNARGIVVKILIDDIKEH